MLRALIAFLLPVDKPVKGWEMEAHQAAQIFHDWADHEGLLVDGPAASIVGDSAEFALIQPVTEWAKQALRSKQIQSIAFSNETREILIFLKRTAPKSKIQLSKLPSSIDGINIRYRQGNPLPIGTLPPQPFGSPPYTLRQTAAGKHVTCGSSISVGNWRDAGTLTCLVRDASGVLYGLANNHVSASCSYADIGLPILAPGVVDVAPNGLDPFTIGYHERALPFLAGSASNVNPKENLDAAIFRIADSSRVSSFQGSAYDTPSAVASITPGSVIEKVGRTSGHTFGRVMGQMYGASAISYSMPLHGFAGLVSFDPLFAVAGVNGIFSDNGDSGSLVTTTDQAGNRYAIGIVVGGRVDANAPGGKTSLILPIQPVLSGLGVELVSGFNVS